MFRGFKKLLDWRQGQVGTRDAKILASTLTVEGLPYEAIPPAMWPEVRRFRKLRSIDRLVLCARYAHWLNSARPAVYR
jgi:hypothetical protein